MKGLIALAFFILLIAVASAKLGPVDELRPALALSEADITIGPREAPRAAALERNYFEAPQPQFNAGSFPCQLQPTVFEKTRLAQSCH